MISLLAVTNGALVQIIMAARVIYGLSATGALPKGLGVVEARSQTPIRATVLVGIAVCLLALWFPVDQLARGTAIVTLVVFVLVNAAALVLRAKAEVSYSPLWSWVGLFSAAGLLLFQLAQWF